MEKRNYYNEGNPEDVTRAALFIFLCVPAKRYLFCKPKWETVRYLWLWGPGKATGRGTDPLQPQAAAGRRHPGRGLPPDGKIRGREIVLLLRPALQARQRGRCLYLLHAGRLR